MYADIRTQNGTTRKQVELEQACGMRGLKGMSNEIKGEMTCPQEWLNRICFLYIGLIQDCHVQVVSICCFFISLTLMLSTQKRLMPEEPGWIVIE
jgi:hypothetical protein